MLLDFEFLLVALAAITLVTVGWAAVLRRRRRAAGQPEPEKENWWVDLCRSLLPVILIVLVIRSFLVEPFRIPSG
ncbi:MAG: signal peptidase I, partial [Ectothiorhodospiraceae bacterium]